MHVLALMLIFAGGGGSSRSVAEAAVIRLVFADEVDEAQQAGLLAQFGVAAADPYGPAPSTMSSADPS